MALRYGMLDPDELDKAGLPLTVRSVFVIDHNKKVRLMYVPCMLNDVLWKQKNLLHTDCSSRMFPATVTVVEVKRFDVPDQPP